MENQDQMVNQEHEEHQDLRDPKEKLVWPVELVCLDSQDHKDQLVAKEHQAKQVLVGPQELKDQQELLD